MDFFFYLLAERVSNVQTWYVHILPTHPLCLKQLIDFLNNSFIEMQFLYYKIQPFKVCSSWIFSIFRELYNHYYYLTLGYFSHSQNKPHIPLAVTPHVPHPPLLPNPWQPLIYWLCGFCLVWTFHLNGILQCVTFCYWFLPLSITFSRSSHIACTSTSFFYGEWKDRLLFLFAHS